MATIDNQTGAPHFWFEQTGPEGERLDVLIVRATFDFAANGDEMRLAKEQQAIAFGDTFSGPIEQVPLRAVVEEDGDLVPYKPGTDILVLGHAQAPGALPHTEWVAGIRVGETKKLLRLHGPRQFRKRFFGWRIDQAKPVIQIPLDYRLAYGGCIDVPAELTGDGEPDWIKHPCNPAGTGWLPHPSAYKGQSKAARKYISKWIHAQRTLAAPQIESAMAPVKHPYHQLATQGLGAIARWWTPRLQYQGSYDDHWRSTRYPLLPDDFSSRFFQSAPPDMVVTPHLKGDETVTLTGLLPEKRDMRLPGWRIIAVVTRESGETTVCLPLLDTVRFHLDQCQATLVWRAHFEGDDPVVEIALAATTAPIDRETSTATFRQVPQ